MSQQDDSSNESLWPQGKARKYVPGTYMTDEEVTAKRPPRAVTSAAELRRSNSAPRSAPRGAERGGERREGRAEREGRGERREGRTGYREGRNEQGRDGRSGSRPPNGHQGRYLQYE